MSQSRRPDVPPSAVAPCPCAGAAGRRVRVAAPSPPLVRARHGHLGRISAFAIGEPDGPIPRQYRCVEPRRRDRVQAQRRGGLRLQRLLSGLRRRRQRRRLRRRDRRRQRSRLARSGSGASFAANIDLSTLDGATGFKLSGAADSDFVGGSVASAGDVNGDASSRSPSPASMSRDLTKAAASASAGAADMIRRVARPRRGLLYAHVRHDLSTASRDTVPRAKFSVPIPKFASL